MNNKNLSEENSYESIKIYPNNIDFEDITTFNFPENVKFLRIDVGLSDDSSQSVEWLLNTDDRGIIAIEPHPSNIITLLNGGYKTHSVSLNNNVVSSNNNVKNIDGKYILINCAIDNVDSLTFQKFYSAYPDHGNSSLIPFQNLKISGNEIEYYINIPTIPLSKILNKIDWEKFDFIEVMKTDTELKDLDVLKSCGDFLKKVVYLRVEAFKGYYPNTITEENPTGWYDTATPIIDFLSKIGFRLIDEIPGDFRFVNEELEHLITKYKLTL